MFLIEFLVEYCDVFECCCNHNYRYENKKMWSKSRGLHKAFKNSGIHLLVKSSKSPPKKLCMRKIILLEYYKKCNITESTGTVLFL